MPEYNKDVVLARYGKILAPEAAEANPEDDPSPSCGGDPALTGSAEGLACSTEGGCSGCCLSLVATVASAVEQKAVAVTIGDTCAMAHDVSPVPPPLITGVKAEEHKA
jgi:hypothetical protein